MKQYATVSFSGCGFWPDGRPHGDGGGGDGGGAMKLNLRLLPRLQ